MKTFEEKLYESFEADFSKVDLESDMLEYLLKRVVKEAVEFDRDKSIDYSKRAKALTNSLISVAKDEELKV